MKIQEKKSGFTTVEIMVSVALFAIVAVLLGSIYSLAQKSYRKGADKSELTQNLRVAFDRMSRELRQAASIETSLPADDNDQENPPANEIFFQDGHNDSLITYTRYYLDGENLMRARLAYCFSAMPGTYVLRTSQDQYGSSPTEIILEDRIVGEYFDSLEFWGQSGLVYSRAKLAKGASMIEAETAIFKRN